jgi:hypothetical protein
MRPLQVENFPQTATGEEEQPDGSRRKRINLREAPR